jgi:hypothetical protein
VTTSTTIEPVAAALVGLINTVTVTAGSGSVTLVGYQQEPKEFDRLPAGTVSTPEITRVPVGEPELQMGSTEWHLSYRVSLYFEITDPVETQSQMKEAVEAFIKAVDANGQLGGLADDSKVTNSVPFYEDNRNRPLVGYECTVMVLKMV